MTRVFVCVVVLLAVLSEGCGEEASREGDAGETAPPPRAAPQVITDADSGESLTLTAGSETRLRLSGEYVWNEPKVRGDAVQLTRVDYFRDPGFSEWVVSAVRPGTATITALGTRGCAGQEGCSDEEARFQVALTVAR